MHRWIALVLSLAPLGVLSASAMLGGSSAASAPNTAIGLPVVNTARPARAASEAPASVPPTNGAPKVVSRADWDGRMGQAGNIVLQGVTRYPDEGRGVFDGIVVHHSDFTEPGGPRLILDYHLDVNGWSDMGYHYVIGQDGTIYEGRPLRYMGAHAGQSQEANRGVVAARRQKGKARAAALKTAREQDPDFGAIGIVLDGFYHVEAPPVAQQKALKRLVAFLQQEHSIPPADVIGHREVHHKRVSARGLTFTGPASVCPGDAGFAWFVKLRQALQREANDAAFKKALQP